MQRRTLPTVCLSISLFFLAGPLVAGELLIGTASVDITPPKPTALCGQLHTRIAHKVRSPLSATAVDEAYEIAKTDVHFDLSLSHHVEDLRLPLRLVTEEEIGEARRQLEELRAEFAELPRQSRRAGVVHRQIGRYETVVERYERQQTKPWLDMELHVIRLGDCAIATNSFKLFLDYGVQIKARSKALHTFLVQLACAADIYLPTERALEGGGYGAGVTVSRVGPEGGRKLVDRTVEAINAMWEDSK